MAGMGLAGNIITVSKQTSLNKALMEKICKLIDDCYAYHDEATDEYHRGVAYDALRWGVGIENGVNYKTFRLPPSFIVTLRETTATLTAANTAARGTGAHGFPLLTTESFRERIRKLLP